MSFKNIAFVLVIGGIGWAVYTGQLGSFIDGLGGAMSSTGKAAADVSD